MTQFHGKAIPEGIHTITPHIIVRNAAYAAEWYQQALGAKARGHRIAVPGDKFMQIELWFGDSAMMIADEFPAMNVLSPLTMGGTSTILTLTVENVNVLWEKAVAAGAQIAHPIQDQFWGDRQGQIVDPFGHRWNLAQHIRDVSDEEIDQGVAQMFKQTE